MKKIFIMTILCCLAVGFFYCVPEEPPIDFSYIPSGYPTLEEGYKEKHAIFTVGPYDKDFYEEYGSTLEVSGNQVIYIESPGGTQELTLTFPNLDLNSWDSAVNDNARVWYDAGAYTYYSGIGSYDITLSIDGIENHTYWGSFSGEVYNNSATPVAMVINGKFSFYNRDETY